MDGNYTISGTKDFLEFSSRAALTKGGLISVIISRWFKSPKQFAKHCPKLRTVIWHFFGRLEPK